MRLGTQLRTVRGLLACGQETARGLTSDTIADAAGEPGRWVLVDVGVWLELMEWLHDPDTLTE